MRLLATKQVDDFRVHDLLTIEFTEDEINEINAVIQNAKENFDQYETSVMNIDDLDAMPDAIEFKSADDKKTTLELQHGQLLEVSSIIMAANVYFLSDRARLKELEALEDKIDEVLGYAGGEQEHNAGPRNRPRIPKP